MTLSSSAHNSGTRNGIVTTYTQRIGLYCGQTRSQTKRFAALAGTLLKPFVEEAARPAAVHPNSFADQSRKDAGRWFALAIDATGTAGITTNHEYNGRARSLEVPDNVGSKLSSADAERSASSTRLPGRVM